MAETGQPITVLSEDDSWNLLASQALGRLVTSIAGQPEIIPVNFAVTSSRPYIPAAHKPKDKPRIESVVPDEVADQLIATRRQGDGSSRKPTSSTVGPTMHNARARQEPPAAQV